MKRLLCFFVSLTAICFAQDDEAKTIYRARAVLKGAPGSGISGEVKLTQKNEGIIPTVVIEALVNGLASGGKHGMHIHEVGSCENSLNASGQTVALGGAGGHFDPGPSGNSQPDANHPFHMGDVPNLVVNEHGIGQLRHTTSRITLSPGPLSVFDTNGSAIILHANEDQGETGAAGSGLSGGPRIACGVIERVGDDDSGNGKKP
ncbi:MAG TPA: superoxide dismutase family protein [Bryobacteraceae bacterium]|nr:superoxide dismutase family protein [Bryobacteraceae bacterium]